MSTDDRIREIEERLANATPGPWKWDAGDIGQDYSVPYCTVFVAEDEYHAIAELGDRENHPDADFIAHAPADIGYLLDKVKRLRNKRDALAEAWTELGPDRPDFSGDGLRFVIAEVKRLRDENHELRSELQKHVAERALENAAKVTP